MKKNDGTIIPEKEDAKSAMIFWIAAAVLLLFNLWMNPSSGSEGRWLAVVQEMINRHDILHPTIDGQPYFDKPLMSYWCGAAFSMLFGGVTEFAVRLPSALFGLLGLYSLISLTGELYDKRTSRLAGWLMLSTYSFLFWGRLAEADMANLSLILTATAVYFKYREKASFGAYALFWVICALGAQMKGLAAIAIPCVIVFADIVLCNRWKTHLNWKLLCSAVIGAGCYFFPFVLEACMNHGNYGANGLVLVFRENLVRVFNPWDHNSDPCWIYFIYLPRLLLPWTIFGILAFLSFGRELIRDWKNASASVKWNMAAVVLIFLIFSISKSRRVYYILPIVPFCVMQTAAFLTKSDRDIFTVISDWILKVMYHLIPVFGLLCFAAPWVVQYAVLPRILPERFMSIPHVFVSLSFFSSISGLILIVLYFCKDLKFLTQERMELKKTIILFAYSLFAVMCVVLPVTGNNPYFRTGKQFYKLVKREMAYRKIPAGMTAIFYSYLADATYYLNLPAPAKHFELKAIKNDTKSFYSDTAEVGGQDEFREFIREAKQKGGMVLIYYNRADHKNLAPDLKREFFASDDPLKFTSGVMMEPLNIFELKKLEQAEKKKDTKAIRKILRKKMLVKFYKPEKK